MRVTPKRNVATHQPSVHHLRLSILFHPFATFFDEAFHRGAGVTRERFTKLFTNLIQARQLFFCFRQMFGKSGLQFLAAGCLGHFWQRLR